MNAKSTLKIESLYGTAEFAKRLLLSTNSLSGLGDRWKAVKIWDLEAAQGGPYAAGSSAIRLRRTWTCIRRTSGASLTSTHDISFYCEDIQTTVAELKGRGVEFEGEVVDAGFGLAAHFTMPGGVRAQLCRRIIARARAEAVMRCA